MLCKYSFNFKLKRFIPLGMVDNNEGPDHSAGPKALISQPFADNRPFDSTTFVTSVHGNELRLFLAKAIPLIIL